jgi:hypothetical protein
MHRSALRFVLVAVVLAVALAPVSGAASQPAVPAASHGALATVISPGESLARLWAWIGALLPGHRPDLAPAATRPAVGSSGSRVRPDDGSALDPNG